MKALKAWKKVLPLSILAVIVLVNLAIQIARFTSYTNFMKNLKSEVTLTKVERAATSTTLILKFTLRSNEKNARAYVSSIQLVLKNGEKDLGYYPIVGDQNMLGVFKNGVFTFSQSVSVPERISKITVLSYKLYAEVHFQVGSHDLRSVPRFEGIANKGAEK